ncbi:hypothetical protein ACSYDW_07155 [Paeniglutamicibacter sp. R2-26]|uniref:hypothetical protein n=1 Tax=Paeniglutamicibacter sp. R2-26 TaxID=3144417 RepID=UPI003EE491BF
MSSLYATTTTDLHRLLALGLTVDQLAHRMGRSVDAVERMLASERGATQDRLAA